MNSNINELIVRRRMSLWDTMKIFFNENLREYIRRSEMLNYLYDRGYESTVSRARQGSSTIDTYRNYLTNVGYLQKISRGRYRVIKEIPVDLTTEEVKYGSHRNKIETHNVFDKINIKKSKKYEFITEEEMIIE